MSDDRFANVNDFSAALHESSISGVAQDNDEQDYDNYDDNSNMNEEPYNPPRISLDPAAACSKIVGVPHQKT